jgi:plasmid stabilization system protein ParE
MEDIEAFPAIIEAGGQTAAARTLGRSLQSVNRSLAALERSVGVELVRRTTRRSFATEAGLAFYRRVKPAFVPGHCLPGLCCTFRHEAGSPKEIGCVRRNSASNHRPTRFSNWMS